MNDERGFETFLATRERLAVCLTDISSALNGVGGGGERAKQLGDSRENLLQDAFRLMIVGEFKRGKSTLVNAMLGKDVLPARVAPCTAIITEVRYADAPKAVLHFHDKEKAPLTVDVADLRKYVVIEDDGDDDDGPDGKIAQSPYALMELHYPLDLCKNNVRIIDSPGLNEHKTRTKVALDFLSRADALVFVLSCQMALAETELSFIDNQLGGRNLHHVFFLWNHFDAIVDSPDDIEDIRKRSRKYLESRIGSSSRIFYVSARSALLGKKNGEAAILEKSGLVPFEMALERFLAIDRGRVKLMTPLRMAETAVREAVTELIPRAEAMLAQPLEVLLKAYEEQKPKLEEIEQQRDRMLRSVERRRDALIREATASYQKFISDTEIGLRNEVGNIQISSWEAIASRKKANEAIASHLQSWLEARSRAWQEKDLAQVFDAHAAALEADIEDQAREFLANIAIVRQALAPNLGKVDQEADVSNANRVMAAVGGLLIGGLGSAIEGGAMGFKGMAKGLALNVGVAAGLVVMGFGLPVVLPVLAAIGIARVVMGSKSAVDSMKDKVVTGLVGELRNAAPETSSQISARITDEFAKLQAGLDASFRIHIEEVAGQVQAILKEKQLGEAHMKAEQARLAAARQSLIATSKTLEAIRGEIDTPEGI